MHRLRFQGGFKSIGDPSKSSRNLGGIKYRKTLKKQLQSYAPTIAFNRSNYVPQVMSIMKTEMDVVQ